MFILDFPDNPDLDYDPTYYGFKDDHAESTLVIDDDRGKYIRDHTTAQDFANWYLMWSCNQHLKMKVKLPLKYMNLEIGDFVDFDAILGGVAPYGIDYVNNDESGWMINGQQFYRTFLITDTNKTLEFVEISCIMMHNLEGACPIDCFGVCGGTGTSDCCNGCQQPENCLQLDICEVCGGLGETSDCGCVDIPPGECDCDGNVLDICEVCGGTGTFIDECGVCDGDDTSCEDCAGVPNGELEDDGCGICDGDNSTCAGCQNGQAYTSMFIAYETYDGIQQHGLFIAIPIVGEALWDVAQNLVPNMFSIVVVGENSSMIYNNATDTWAHENSSRNLVLGDRVEVVFREDTETSMFYDIDPTLDCTYLINPSTGLTYATPEGCCIPYQDGYCQPYMSRIHIQSNLTEDIDEDNTNAQTPCNVDFTQENTPRVDITNDIMQSNEIHIFLSGDFRYVIEANLNVFPPADATNTITSSIDDHPFVYEDLGNETKLSISEDLQLFGLNDPVVGNIYVVYFVFEIKTTDIGGTVEFTYTDDFAISITRQGCVALGDMNNDGGWNVIDVVKLANCVLAGDCSIDCPSSGGCHGCAGDMNGDGGWNVLDVVTLANCILSGNCGE